MSEIIACTPRTLPPERCVEAAERAIKINPQNRPGLEGLVEVIPEFSVTPQRLAVATTKYWGVGGVRLTVGFLDDPPTDLRRKILAHMNAWSQTANVEFLETARAEDAQVRINRQRTGDQHWDGYWSFLGTDILDFHGPLNQTMNLEGFTMNTPDSEFFRVVRHETGHTLGFPHEHMRKELVQKIDPDKAIAFYKRLTGWTRQQVIQQVLTPLEESSIRGTAHADPKSIMAYQVPGDITIDGKPIIGGTDIAESDFDFAGVIYPK